MFRTLAGKLNMSTQNRETKGIKEKFVTQTQGLKTNKINMKDKKFTLKKNKQF